MSLLLAVLYAIPHIVIAGMELCKGASKMGWVDFTVYRAVSAGRFFHLLVKCVLFLCVLGVSLQWGLGFLVGIIIRSILQTKEQTDGKTQVADRKDKFNIHIGWIRYSLNMQKS